MLFKPYLNQNYDTLKTKLLKRSELFEDSFFPANPNSLYRFQNITTGIKVYWKRPFDICNSPKFIVDSIVPNDLFQGQLGNCWVIAAASSLLSVPEYLNRVIPTDQSFEDDAYAGIFHFRFWHDGEWTEVVVDDRLPVDENNKLIFCQNLVDNNEMFGPLLEKAYAKLNICYEFLDGGLAEDALVDFTGGVSETLNLKRSSKLVNESRFIDPSKLWNIIFKSNIHKSLMSCSASADKSLIESVLGNGIVLGHAYSIIDVYEIIEKKGNQIFRSKDDSETYSKSICLLKLRNPWGQKNSFSGRWSMESEEWQKIAEEVKEKIGHKKQQDGQFLMNLEDFILNFDVMVIVHVDLTGIVEDSANRINWTSQKYFGELKSFESSRENDDLVRNPHYEIRVSKNKFKEKTYIIVSLIQTKIASRRGETDGTFENSLEAIGFKLFASRSLANNNKYVYNSNFKQINGTKKFMYKKEVSKRMELTPEIIKIVPCVFKNDKLVGYVLRIYIEKGNSIFRATVDNLPSPILESHDYYFRTETLELQHSLDTANNLHNENSDGTRHDLAETESERDIGIQLTRNLKWGELAKIAANRANFTIDHLDVPLNADGPNITLAEVVKRGLNTKSSDFEANLALANNKLTREREKRASNIMIFGLKCDNDKHCDDQVNDLVGVLSLNSCQIKRIVKLVPKNSNLTRPPPILVEFDSPSTSETALKSTRALKTHERFVGVQVAPDLTPSERLGLKLEHDACVEMNSKLPADSPFEWRV
ncbi:calpain-5, partial [Brachionus plicatilis]